MPNSTYLPSPMTNCIFFLEFKSIHSMGIIFDGIRFGWIFFTIERFVPQCDLFKKSIAQDFIYDFVICQGQIYASFKEEREQGQIEIINSNNSNKPHHRNSQSRIMMLWSIRYDDSIFSFSCQWWHHEWIRNSSFLVLCFILTCCFLKDFSKIRLRISRLVLILEKRIN